MGAGAGAGGRGGWGAGRGGARGRASRGSCARVSARWGEVLWERHTGFRRMAAGAGKEEKGRRRRGREWRRTTGTRRGTSARSPRSQYQEGCQSSPRRNETRRRSRVEAIRVRLAWDRRFSSRMGDGVACRSAPPRRVRRRRRRSRPPAARRWGFPRSSLA